MNDILLASRTKPKPRNVATFTRMTLTGQSMPNLRLPIAECTAGKILIWGGTISGTNTVTIDTNTWQVARLPGNGVLDCVSSASAVRDRTVGTILVSFGVNGDIDRTFLYDLSLSTGTTTSRTPPIWTSKFTAYCNNSSEFYILGGNFVDQLRVYNFTSNSWSYKTTTSQTTNGSAGLANGNIYLHGGTTAANLDTLYRINPSTGATVNLGPTGFKRRKATQWRPAKGKLFSFGGENEAGVLQKSLLMLDPETEQVTQVGEVPLEVPALRDSILTYDNNYLYLVAGTNSNNAYNQAVWRIAINI